MGRLFCAKILGRGCTLLLLWGTLALFHGAFAQHDRVITGIVLDDIGEPLSAAHVKQVRMNEKEEIVTILTDYQGHFRMSIPSTAAEIEVSFIGMETRRVKLTTASSYQITLITASELLEEVMVTGYQTISRERATGAFAKLGGEKLEQKRLNTLSSLLEGQVAGYNNGLIRGTTSMNGVSNPLYVIDGFPVENTTYDSYGLVENLPLLNMEDIESITVLKDAAAASIYGARAANGVIVITTKKAAKGKTNISFSTSLTFTPYSYYKGNLLGAEDIIDIEREWAQSNPKLQSGDALSNAQSALTNRVYQTEGIKTILKGITGEIALSEVENRLNTLSGYDKRYFKEVEKYAKRNPFTQQYNLSIAKSNEVNRFNFSTTYRNNKLEDKRSANESIGLNIINSSDLTKWLTMEVGAYINFSRGTIQTFSALSPGYTYMPYDGLVNEDGSYFTSKSTERYSENYQNTLNKYGLYSMDITPLDEVNMNIRKNRNFSSRSSLKFNLKLTPWLKYSTMFQYEYGSYRMNLLLDKNSFTVRNKVNAFASIGEDGNAKFNLPYGNIYYTEDQYTNAYNFRQQLDFNKVFNDKHDVTVILGNEFRENKIEYKRNSLYNYDPDMLTYTAIDAMALSSVSSILGGNYWSESDMTAMYELLNRFVSLYGNAGYTYDSKYTATASIRWDRSNLWGTDSKYQNKPLWSVGAAWNTQNEDFFTPEWVNQLKLRLSYGIGGNIAKNAAPYMTAYYYTNTNVGGLYGSIGSRPNPQLRWEKTATTNVGVDYSLFGGRLNGSIDYYYKQGKDLLANTMGVPTEGFGYSTYKVNNGEMTNRGIELSLSGTLIRKKDFSWNMSLLYSYNKNKVTYVNLEAPVYYLQFDYPTAYPRVGNPFNAIYAYKWAGLNEKGQPQVYNGNGEATANDPYALDAIVYAGSTEPTYYGSWGSTVTYKDFDFSFLFVFEGGHKARNTFLPYIGGSYSSILGGYATSLSGRMNKRINNRWRKAGDEQHTDVPALIFAESADFNSNSAEVYNRASVNVINMSNMRLSNISLAYRIPKQLCQKACLSSARIQFNVENLCTIARSRDAKYMLGGYNAPNLVWGLFVNF